MSSEGVLPDVITFAGNGEPTLHPEFEGVIEDTIYLRDKYAPAAKISVLSNATQLHREDVVRALKRVDNNILKLDAALDSTVVDMNKPCCNYSVEMVIDQLAAFNGELVVQIMFLRGEYNGKKIDNTTAEHISALRSALQRIHPKQIMCYTIARDTPCKTLQAAPAEEIARLQAELGY
jgi:wyosine [tRNA(Phe)-imidazoG37] synthetase (radical SAM superfamily)